MKNKVYYILIFCSLYITAVTAQDKNDELKITTEEVAVKKKKEKEIPPYEPLAPARAAFYSAILPGLGQAYTKKYWKIPIVYGAIGTGIYFYRQNNNTYRDLRNTYKARLAGEDPNNLEFSNLTDNQLIDLQRRFRRDAELALLVTVGLYVLNIVDANVTAHLQQYSISEDLSLRPKMNFNDLNAKPNYGLSLSYSF
ncbi:DUF5683 domain-containing protein [Aquimarina brevivitae]|uniref:DUF5683 domain-containing protein n=1 Tax=Aquimarina brevivitae TaxID=323412 RepID=A0A4Q7P144_9FLAO|nr:DUF5683 domain-containing protein [Aquimarina brevivitae]RZS93277.1 hypothetical protein EV197_1853 [Aquimarina brevivitae]